MNKKQRFLDAVQILTSGDGLILNAAQYVGEECLPQFPGAAALEFVTAMKKLTPFVRARGARWECRTVQWKPTLLPPLKCCRGGAMEGKKARKGLLLSDAIRVKSAEYWLRLGQPGQAMMELQKLPETAKKHPWAVKVLASVVGALRVTNEYATGF